MKIIIMLCKFVYLRSSTKLKVLIKVKNKVINLKYNTIIFNKFNLLVLLTSNLFLINLPASSIKF